MWESGEACEAAVDGKVGNCAGMEMFGGVAQGHQLLSRTSTAGYKSPFAFFGEGERETGSLKAGLGRKFSISKCVFVLL